MSNIEKLNVLLKPYGYTVIHISDLVRMENMIASLVDAIKQMEMESK